MVDTHIVGRDREVDLLRGAIEEAAAGRGSAWYLTGEPGIGKSFLAEEVARLAHERGLRVFWGRCWEAGGAPAYWPWVQILRGVRHSSGDASLESHLEVLAQLLPEVVQTKSPAHDGLPPEQARFRLMDAVSNVLAEAARETPMVLILEDLHVADVSTVLLLEFLSGPVRHEPFLLVGTFREAELARAPAGAQLRRTARLGEQLPLERFGKEDVAAFLATGGETADSALVGALQETTDGHPLFLAEIERLWRARGGTKRSGSPPIPASVRTTIQERLATVAPSCLAMLRRGSVVGREFDIGLLEACHDANQYSELAREAAESSILVEVAPERYRFVHFLIREQVYESIPEEHRSAWHAKVAESLKMGSHGAEPRWSEVAHHLVAARRCREAVTAYRKAGAQALQQLAFDEAVAAHQSALRAAHRAEGASATDLIELRLELAHALNRNGDVDAAKAACVEAAAAARAINDAELLARASLEHGAALQYVSIDRGLVALLEEALEVLETRDSALRARVLARLAAATQPAEDPEGPIALAREGIAMARRIEDSATLLDTLRNGGSAMVDLGDLNERLLVDRELAMLGEELDNPVEALRGHLRSVMDYLSLDRLNDAFRAIHACERLTDRLEHPAYTWRSVALRALRALWEGRLDDAERLIEESHRLGTEASDPNSEAVFIAQKLRLLQYRGDFDAQLPVLERLSKLSFGNDIGTAFARIMIGEEHALAGRLELARGYYDRETVNRLFRLSDDSIQLSVARLAVAAGDDELAERLHRQMTVNRDHMVNGGVFLMVLEGPVTWGLAWMSQMLGRRDEASEHFAHALEVARRSGGRPVTALIALEHAHHLADAGKPEFQRRARELCVLARDTAAEVGMKVVEADASSLIESLEAAATPTADEGPPPLAMSRNGDSWLVSFGNVEFHVKDVRGVRILAALVAEPGREFHVIDLSSSPSESSERVDLGDSGVEIDEEARRQYRARVGELREELAEAEEWNDTGRADRARKELDAIESELSRAVGLGGRQRRRGSAAERARVNVQRRIRDAIRRIEEFHPSLAKHLDRSVRTGTYCSYDP